MTQWYYADDARNRIGPLPADELREHYRQRRLRRDSLVWREGMTQWLPLEGLAFELDLDAVTPDATLPPPMPATGPGPTHAPIYAPVRTPHKKQGMSGCVIALLVCAGLAIPVIAILAAIALPAYNDYTHRTRVMEAMASTGPLQLAIAEHLAREGGCPDDDSASVAEPLQQLRQNPRVQGIRIGTLQGGRCAFEITLHGIDSQVDGKTLLFEAGDEAASRWNCSGGDLPDRYRPRHCRANPTGTST